jgi:putative membrane protein
MILPAGPHQWYLIRSIGRSLAIIFAFDIVVAVGYVYLGWTWVAHPEIPLSLFGGAIGVVVGFRNTSSYARWWEARTLWGSIVNYSRTLSRQALSMIDIRAESESECAEIEAMRRAIIYHQIAYVHAFRCQLRGQKPWSDIKRLLSDPEIASLQNEKNVAVAIQQRLASLLKECHTRGWIDTIQWASLEDSLTGLANAQGGAERIKNTPMPGQYDFLPQLFVRVYCLLLPFGMVKSLELLTPIGSSLVGLMFLALDQIGRDLESPFENDWNDVPLTAISKTIEINLRQLLGETTLPEPEKPIRGVLW